MWIVAIIAVPSPLERAVPILAEAAGLTAYEARARLSGEPPRIVAVLADGDAAERLGARLSKEGFSGVVLRGEDVEHDEGRDMVASLGFEPETLDATLRDGLVRKIAWSDVVLILRGTRTSVVTKKTEEKTRKFDAGRALLTGGLVTQRTVTSTSTTTNRSRQAFLYVYERDGSPAVALYEQRVSYAFLGKAVQPSSLANFQTVVAEVRKRAPNARFDDRLNRTPTLGAAPLPPHGADPEGWKVDLAASILAMDARRRLSGGRTSQRTGSSGAAEEEKWDAADRESGRDRDERARAPSRQAPSFSAPPLLPVPFSRRLSSRLRDGQITS